MAKMRELKCQNEWWNSYGPRVKDILTVIEEKRFQNTYEGDVNYTEIIFVLQGLVFALEKAQLEVDELKSVRLEINSFKDAIQELNDTVKEKTIAHEKMVTELTETIDRINKERETEQIEAEVTISKLENDIKIMKDEDVITD